jgi:hypothetical protein
MEDHAGEPVAVFAAIQLDKNAAAIALIINEPQQIERLDQAPEFLKRPGASSANRWSGGSA